MTITVVGTGGPKRSGIGTFLFVALAVFYLIIGLLLGYLIANDPGYRVPLELTSEERLVHRLEQKLWPLQMSIRVISEKQFEEEQPTDSLAFTKPTSSPCQITIPDTWVIVFNPSDKFASGAYWKESIDGDILAHEILHCYRGHWHP